MTALLLVLTILMAAVLLTALAVALLLILKALQSVRGQLEKIVMGVRAIERQATHVGPGVSELADDLAPLADALGRAGARLERVAAPLGNRIRRNRG